MITLPLQRLGHNVWPVHTVMLSNHAGYPDHGGRAVPVDELADVIDALDRRGALARCDGVLSGYLGDAAVGEVVLDAVARVRKYNDKALYCCDPVIGDGGEIYVGPGIPEFFSALAAPAADVLTPNLFELSVLTGSHPHTLDGAPLDDIIAVARTLIAPGRRTSTILVTSLTHAALAPTDVAIAAITETGGWIVTTPKLSFATSPHGAGDCCAALFCSALLEDGDPATALSRAASAVYALLEETARLGKNEFALVEAQDLMVEPERIFRVETIF